jgi:hypothetical protein
MLLDNTIREFSPLSTNSNQQDKVHTLNKKSKAVRYNKIKYGHDNKKHFLPHDIKEDFETQH